MIICRRSGTLLASRSACVSRTGKRRPMATASARWLGSGEQFIGSGKIGSGRNDCGRNRNHEIPPGQTRDVISVPEIVCDWHHSGFVEPIGGRELLDLDSLVAAHSPAPSHARCQRSSEQRQKRQSGRRLHHRDFPRWGLLRDGHYGSVGFNCVFESASVFSRAAKIGATDFAKDDNVTHRRHGNTLRFLR
jgi:hypothetical protein